MLWQIAPNGFQVYLHLPSTSMTSWPSGAEKPKARRNLQQDVKCIGPKNESTSTPYAMLKMDGMKTNGCGLAIVNGLQHGSNFLCNMFVSEQHVDDCDYGEHDCWKQEFIKPESICKFCYAWSAFVIVGASAARLAREAEMLFKN